MDWTAAARTSMRREEEEEELGTDQTTWTWTHTKSDSDVYPSSLHDEANVQTQYSIMKEARKQGLLSILALSPQL